MSNAERLENRSTIMYAIGLIIAGSGILSFMIGAIYIVRIKTAHFVISTIGDSWMQALVVNQYNNCWIGIMLLCLGTLLKWRAEDDQMMLEKTNRSVSYDTLMANRSEGR